MLIKRSQRHRGREETSGAEPGKLSDASKSGGAWDRRAFLKRSGVTVGALTAVGNLPLGSIRKAEAGPPPPAGATVTTRKNICTHCSVGCSVIAEVANGVWIGQEPDYDSPINRGSHCCKGAAVRDDVLSQRRLRYPVKLVNGQWVRISWDTAIDEIGDKLLEIRQKSGPDSVYWLGSAKFTNEAAYLNRKLAAFWGTNNSDHQARICHSTTVTGVANTWGYGAMTNSYNDIRNSKTILIMGGNPAEAHPVSLQHILEGKELNRANMIVVDPRMTRTAAHATEYVRVRPGTHIATVYGMLWHIFENGWEDKEFLSQRVYGVITTIGLDLAKSIFQVHGVDATGQVVVRKSLRRSQMLPFFAKLPSCLIGIEACGTSRHWARELIKLGHEVRLMPPAYVKPYVKRGKTDAADAEAVCEAVTRPTMRFVPVKSPEQQAALSMHRTRDLLVKQRTQLINMIRGLLAEFGVDIPKGLERALLMARQIVDGRAPDVPIEAAKIVGTLSQQALDTHVRLREIDRDLLIWLRSNEVARRLTTIPGIGPVGATALAASVTDPHQFRSGRQFSAWIGLTPLQKSSGGKERLGRSTKMGDKYLRKPFIVGMTSLVRLAKYNPATIDSRLADLLARKPTRVATVAMANKTARVIWAIMSRGETYRTGHRPALAA